MINENQTYADDEKLYDEYAKFLANIALKHASENELNRRRKGWTQYVVQLYLPTNVAHFYRVKADGNTERTPIAESPDARFLSAAQFDEDAPLLYKEATGVPLTEKGLVSLFALVSHKFRRNVLCAHCVARFFAAP